MPNIYNIGYMMWTDSTLSLILVFFSYTISTFWNPNVILKGEFFRLVVRSAVRYGLEQWVVHKKIE